MQRMTAILYVNKVIEYNRIDLFKYFLDLKRLNK